MKRKVRMIAFDLDGTLLTTDKRLTDETRRTLEQVAEKGILLVPATGRPLTGMPAEVLGIPGSQIRGYCQWSQSCIYREWEDPAGEADLRGKSQKSLGYLRGI